MYLRVHNIMLTSRVMPLVEIDPEARGEIII